MYPQSERSDVDSRFQSSGLLFSVKWNERFIKDLEVLERGIRRKLIGYNYKVITTSAIGFVCQSRPILLPSRHVPELLTHLLRSFTNFNKSVIYHSFSSHMFLTSVAVSRDLRK